MCYSRSTITRINLGLFPIIRSTDNKNAFFSVGIVYDKNSNGKILNTCFLATVLKNLV